MAARILALLAAVAMVAAALVVRGNLDGEDGDGGGSSATTPRIVCATELAAVCETLDDDQGSRVETMVEAVDETAARLISLGPGGRPPMDGWLVTSPWPEIVDGARMRDGRAPLLTAGDVLARSPVVLAVRADRSEVLAQACGGQVNLRCLGDVAAKAWAELPGGKAEWGKVKPGHPPARTVAGLTVLGAATVSYHAGNSNLSLTELEEAGFQAWLRSLEGAQPRPDPSPFLTMLSRPTAFDVVGVLEAEVVRSPEAAPDRKPFLLYPSPVATADVVLATTAGRPGRRLAELVSGTATRDALATSGWRVNPKPLAGIPGSVPLPDTTNLPAPDVLDALSREAVEAGP